MLMGTFARGVASALMVLVLGVVWSTPSAAATKWTITLKTGSKGEAKSSFSAPTGVVGTCVSSSENIITVSWTALAHATSYTVYDSTTSSSAGFSVIASTVSGTSWTSGSLGAGTYWFQVSSHVSNWTSANSASSSPRMVTNGPGCS